MNYSGAISGGGSGSKRRKSADGDNSDDVSNNLFISSTIDD